MIATTPYRPQRKARPVALELGPDAGNPFADIAKPFDDIDDPFDGIQGKKDDAGAVYFRDLRPRPAPRPFVWIFIGPRGEGKSSCATAFSRIELEAMLANGKEWKVWTNVHLSFAEKEDPNIILEVEEFNDDARNLSLVLEEITTAIPSARATSTVNLHFRRFLEQIRKRNIRVYSTCQFPQDLDGGFLRQVNFFIRCKRYGNRVALFVHDHFGQVTGKQIRKTWPPQPGDEDWRKWLHNFGDLAFGHFISGEVVLPLNAPDRDNRLTQTGWAQSSGDPELDAQLDEEREANRLTAQMGRDFLDELSDGRTFDPKAVLPTAMAYIDGVDSLPNWIKVLQRNGFSVDRASPASAYEARWTGQL